MDVGFPFPFFDMMTFEHIVIGIVLVIAIARVLL